MSHSQFIFTLAAHTVQAAYCVIYIVTAGTDPPQSQCFGPLKKSQYTHLKNEDYTTELNQNWTFRKPAMLK